MRFLREAAEAGLGLIDTAHVYTGGDSERAIGEALSPKPDGLVVATKGGYSGRGSPEALREQIEQSLASLRTDSIDLYYLHRVDPETPLEESLGAIAEYRDAGTIREVGISAVERRADRGGAAGRPDRRRSEPLQRRRAGLRRRRRLLRGERDRLRSRTSRSGRRGHPPSARSRRPTAPPPHQIALAWLLRRSPVMLPIPGTLSIEHLRENLGALEIELTDEEFAALG